MSVPVLHLKCVKCGLSGSQSCLVGDFYYKPVFVDDNRTCSVDRGMGYCEVCAKFGAVERLDLPRIKQELEENAANAAKSTESRKRLQRGLRHWLGLNRGIIERVDKDLAFWEKMKVELEFHRSICEERKDGPKCLECSSNKVTAILLDWDKIPKDGTPALAEQVHPGCGGLIEVTRSQLRFAFQQKRPTYYNPQGERYASLSRHLFD